MARQPYFLEFGMDVDVHGADSTKAARRAVFDAIRHSSVLAFQAVRARGGSMLVDVTVGVPNAASVDLEAVKQELPHGTVTVTAVEGGVRAPVGDALIACATVLVTMDLPDSE